MSAEQQDEIDMKKNEAYERTSSAPQEIIMKDNPSYELAVQNFTRSGRIY